jgi:lipoate-protein ligase B
MHSAQNKNTSMMTEAPEKYDLRIYDCRLADYRRILKLQKQLWEKRYNDEIPNTILIVEHQTVITLGARKEANKLHEPPEKLKKRGIDVVEIRRGGGVTAHNPGQLVFYPILKLQQLDLGITEYIRTLEAIGIELLSTFNIHCKRRSGYPGLWVSEKKIASIGVRVSRFVTYHGMAININNDLGIFDLFVPCGIEGIGTSREKTIDERC